MKTGIRFSLITTSLLITLAFAQTSWSKHYAVCAGVLGDGLRYTANDARLMQKVLNSGSADVKLLVTDGQAKPTKSAIYSALQEQMVKATPSDVLWFYFSGHGLKHSEDGRTMLVPEGYQNGNWSTFIDVSALRRELRSGTKAKLVVIVMDSCHSGAVKSSPFANLNSMLAPMTGTAVLSACRGDQVSLESPLLRHGLFTYLFVRGLAGAAKAPVSLRSVHEYVKTESARFSSGPSSSREVQEPVFQFFEGDPGAQGPITEPAPDVLNSLPEPSTGSQMVPVAPLPPAVIVHLASEGDHAPLVQDLGSSRLRSELIKRGYPVVRSEYAAAFLQSTESQGGDAGSEAYKLFGSQFLLRVKAIVSIRPSRFEGQDYFACNLTLTGQVLTADGRVLVEEDSDSSAGLTVQGAGFSAERAVRVALGKALDVFMSRAIASMDSTVKPSLDTTAPRPMSITEMLEAGGLFDWNVNRRKL